MDRAARRCDRGTTSPATGRLGFDPCAAFAALAAATGCVEERSNAAAGGAPAAVVLSTRSGSSPIQLTDATAASGVDFVHDAGFDGQGWYYVEVMGSGVAAFDADGDDDVDLCFLNGHRLSSPPPEPRSTTRFFRNDGSGCFTDATLESGLGDRRYAQGCCVADYDNDGDLDLYVTMFDEGNALYRNDGSGRFEDVAAAAGALGRPDAVDAACAFADVDNDGHVDLYVGACLAHTRTANKECSKKDPADATKLVRIYCPPRTYPPLPDLLLRNRGDGTFEDVTHAAGLSGLDGRTLGVAFADFDDDGDVDAFVACDNTPNYLLENDGNGRFRDVGEAAGVALAENGSRNSGMGTATGDFDGDGRIDVVATYFEGECNGLYRNTSRQGDISFENLDRASGTGHHSYPLLAWGTALVDLDLDGRKDWIVANGHTQPFVERYGKTMAGYRQPLLVQLNRGESLFESLGEAAGEVVARKRAGRGLAVADLDGDGDLDLALNNRQEPAEIVRNDSPRAGRRWLLVKAVGSASNRAAIGARITVTAGGRTQVAEVASGQSFYSQGDLRVHFGLGDAATIDVVEVRWPSGRRSRVTDAAVDRQLTIFEPTEAADTVAPRVLPQPESTPWSRR